MQLRGVAPRHRRCAAGCAAGCGLQTSSIRSTCPEPPAPTGPPRELKQAPLGTRRPANRPAVATLRTANAQSSQLSRKYIATLELLHCQSGAVTRGGTWCSALHVIKVTRNASTLERPHAFCCVPFA